jgi:hypothetical protein
VSGIGSCSAPPDSEDGATLEGNVIDDDDEGEGEESIYERSGIPRQWLNASFALSDDGTGLVLKSPSEADISGFSWHQQASGSVHVTAPPPFHCSSLTALLSIVTALLYTGATCQAQSISRSSTRPPFQNLTETERKREFESRLADVLAALLHIAAKASRSRKEEALKSMQGSKDPADKLKWQKLVNKLRLCPTCWWEIDSKGDIVFPQGRDLDRKLQVATSYTNIEDLRSYVLSNMQSFTSPGGCALFLESVVRIHGKGAVLRMVERSKLAANVATAEKSLIQCTCEEHSKRLSTDPQQLKNRSKTKQLMEAVPAGALDCMSIELVSLLLTGKVHATLMGWSTGPLGIGLLSVEPDKVGKGLSRPETPVWILRGRLYSVLWLNQTYDGLESFARADQPTSTVELTHFSCWPGQRSKTNLRLSPDRSKWSDPGASKTRAIVPPSGYSATVELLLRRRKECICLSSNELEAVDIVDSELLVTDEHVETNPEDQKFYPENYHLWRYCIGNGSDAENTQVLEWIPYHRLSDRQKLLVETKLGPKISSILRTRWPRAKIEGFDPERPPPLV